MPTYKAKATATASVTAQFFFRKEEVVTASGSATAESDVSQEDAYNTALSIAKEVAQSAAQNDANVLIQSVNTSTLGDNTLFLSSSLLKDYFERNGKFYILKKTLELPRELRLFILKDETLNVSSGTKLNVKFTNLGTINQLHGSEVTVGGLRLRNPQTNEFNKYIKKGVTNASDTEPTSNSGTYTVSGSPFTVPSGDTYTNETLSGQSTATFTINSGGVVNNNGTFDNGIPSTTTGYVNGATFTNQSGGIVNNYGIFNNNLVSDVNNSGTFYNSASVNNSGTFNNGTSTDSTPIIYNFGTFNNNGTSISSSSTYGTVNIFGSFYFENNSVFNNNCGIVNYESNNANFQGDPNASDPTYSIKNNYTSSFIYGLIKIQNSANLTVTTNGTLYSNLNQVQLNGTGTIVSSPFYGNTTSPNGQGKISLQYGSTLIYNGF
jgi:hypothetical protein